MVAVAHDASLCSVCHHTVCELGKGLEIETHKDSQRRTETGHPLCRNASRETRVTFEARMLQECPLYCVQGQLI